MSRPRRARIGGAARGANLVGESRDGIREPGTGEISCRGIPQGQESRSSSGFHPVERCSPTASQPLVWALHPDGTCKPRYLSRKASSRTLEFYLISRRKYRPTRRDGQASQRRSRSVSRSYSASRDCTMTLASPRIGMKLVSPCQRGTMCQCRWPGNPAPAASPRLTPML